MASVASIYNIPANQQSLEAWSWNHMAHHRDINRRIFETQQVNLEELVLDPMTLDDMENWLYRHQTMHNAQNQRLNISGFNLLNVDWADPGQRASWIYLHALEHVKAGDQLGV